MSPAKSDAPLGRPVFLWASDGMGKGQNKKEKLLVFLKCHLKMLRNVASKMFETIRRKLSVELFASRAVRLRFGG